MDKEIIIITILPEVGTTGVQSHFNSLSKFLKENNLDNKIITPYTYKQSFLNRLYSKIVHIINKINSEQAIIFSREQRINSLENNLLHYIENNTQKSYFIYAQDPSTALMAINLKNRVSSAEIKKINLICHFNISEIHEYVISQNVSDSGALARYLYKKENEALRLVDKIIFPSNFLQKTVLKRVEKAVSYDKTEVINNFVEDSLKESGLEDIQTDFLSIGTLEARKNQEFAIRIIFELHKLGFKKKLTLIGDGPDRYMLQELAKSLNIDDYIVFKGYIKNAKEFLNKTNFLLHTAKMENFPITLLEALSYGVPVCAASVGGIPEIFDTKEEGIYLELDNPKKCAEDISYFFNDKHYRMASEKSRERFIKNFNSKEIAPKLYKAIIGDTI